MAPSATAPTPGAGSLSLKWLVSRRLGFEMREIVDLLGKNGAKQLAHRPGAHRRRPALRLRERRLHPAPARAPGERAARAATCGSSSPTSRCRSCPCSRAWRRPASPSTSASCARCRQGLNEQIDVPRAEGLRRRRPRVQHRLAAAALAGAVRGARLPKTRKTKQGYTTDAQAIEGLRGVHPIVDLILRVARADEAQVDLHRRRCRAPSTRGRAHPHHLQPGRRRDRPPLVEQPEPAEHPRAQRARRPGPPRLHRPRHRRGPDAARRRLLADRAAHHGAHVAGPGLLEAFRNDEDIHAATASQVFGVPFDEVTREQRSRAKVFNFGVLYGLTEFGLAAARGHPPRRGGAFIKRYFEKYEAVKALARRDRRPDARATATPRRWSAAAATSRTSTAPTSTSAWAPSASRSTCRSRARPPTSSRSR